MPSILMAIRHWGGATAIDSGTTAFIVYIVVVWAEIIAGGILSVLAIVAFFLPRGIAAPSFWCGLCGAPVFLGIGLWCLMAGRNAVAG